MPEDLSFELLLSEIQRTQGEKQSQQCADALYAALNAALEDVENKINNALTHIVNHVRWTP